MQVEERGSTNLYHWLFFMIAGLRHFPNTRNPSGDGVTSNFSKERNTHLYQGQPYDFIWIPSIEGKEIDFQIQTLDMLSPKYKLIRTEEIKPDDIVIFNWGEILDYQTSSRGNGINCEAYRFLRDLLGDPINNSVGKKRRVYIRRSRAHILNSNNGIRRRQIINEEEVVATLESTGIECLYLEDMTISEKVRLFSEADMVVSPNSAGLSFCTFMHNGSRVLELNVDNPHQISGQYMEICNCLGLQHHRMYTHKVDPMDNMEVDIDSLMNLIKSL